MIVTCFDSCQHLLVLLRGYAVKYQDNDETQPYEQGRDQCNTGFDT